MKKTHYTISEVAVNRQRLLVVL